MQYLIIAYDYEDALERRLKVRDEHLKATKELIKKGKIVEAGALLEDEKMVGSSLFVNFENDEELDSWLENEPYVVNKVWDLAQIQIVPVKLLPKN
ncbi:YciI family protein [Arcobacter vandammei]|uniref:YciI family protein n=1 Tax=Arcobacter vandammei TaxID=2782243 RepID=UPI0018E064EA|nr:YciI family protein [Arcobacter vandammei]